MAMKRHSWLTVVGLLFVGVIGFGGCGGDGGGTQPPPPQQLLINEGNAQGAGAEALRALVIMSDVSDFGAQLAEILVSLPVVPRHAARVSPLLVEGVCDQGTTEVTVDDVAPVDELSTGDSAEITFTGCLMGDTTFNGTISMSVTDVVATSSAFPVPPYDVTFSLGLASLSVSDNVGTTVVSGGAELNLESLVPFVHVSRLSGTSLTMTEDGFFESLSEFTFVETSPHILQGAGKFASSDLGGDFVMFETTEDFVRLETDDYPYSGVLAVYGASSSSLTVRAVDNTKVEMALDADGNGTTDEGFPIEVLWNDLDL